MERALCIYELALSCIKGMPFSFSQALTLAVKFSSRATRQNYIEVEKQVYSTKTYVREIKPQHK
jgi:hypothetical protein